jgi:hypothetical protein
MSKHLLNKDGEGPMELLKGDKLHPSDGQVHNLVFSQCQELNDII